MYFHWNELTNWMTEFTHLLTLAKLVNSCSMELIFPWLCKNENNKEKKIMEVKAADLFWQNICIISVPSKTD